MGGVSEAEVKTVRVSVSIGPYARRDRYVAWLAGMVLRLASRRYRAMIGGAVRLGLKTAAMGEADRLLPASTRFLQDHLRDHALLGLD
jgi:hypothetical protein